MSKRKKQKRNPAPKSPDTLGESAGKPFKGPSPDGPFEMNPWSKSKRRIATVLIIGYLFVLLIGPLSNPVASPYLSGPIAAKISPVHRAMFLGHGYRFFGPDPGPSHLLVFQGKRADGSTFEGVFPDRDENWPRLLYHRWFMLSETIFNENVMLPSPEQFESRSTAYRQQIDERQKSGQLKLATQLKLERDIEAQQYQTARQRVEVLGHAVADLLRRRHAGESIELFIQIRQIPLAEEVASGMKLEDESLLSDLLPIGALDSSGFQVLSPSIAEPADQTLETPSNVNPFPVTMPSPEESR